MLHNSPRAWVDCDAAQATNVMDYLHLLNTHGSVQGASEVIARSGDACHKGSWIVYVNNLVSQLSV